MESLQPTIHFQATDDSKKKQSWEQSKACLGFVAGSQSGYSAELAGLLRQRLAAAAAIVATVLTATFISGLLTDTNNLWALRLAVLCVSVGIVALLRLKSSLTLLQLRIIELTLFGASATQLLLMFSSRMNDFADLRDATSLVSIYKEALAAWSVLIFIYGTLIPNSWRRGAAIMFPAAAIPYIVLNLQTWMRPEIADLLAMNKATSILPIPFVAAFVSTFAAYVISTVRREAFKAKRFGQYQLLEKLGSGGMGEVYKAEHLLLKRPCAIKIIKTACESDAQAVARFEKEVKLTARLTHWNTVEIYDYGRTDDGTFYYVMELLPGLSVGQIVERFGPLPPERVVYLITQICSALEEAHSTGMIHRDVKPANIFASQRGGVYDVAKLLDFGLVKSHDDASDRIAKLGSFSGTPQFMAPEQATDYDRVDGRADIYSLGVVVYYLATGRTPFSSNNLFELVAAHLNADVPPPSRFNPNINADLEAVILKCMAKKPSDRFSTVQELRKALEGCLVNDAWGPDQARDWWETRNAQVRPTSPTSSADFATTAFTPSF